MENKNSFSITKYDFFATVAISVIGAGGFSYGRELSETVGKNGQYVAIICGVISVIALLLIYHSSKIYGFKEFTHIAEKSFGKIIGKIVALEFSICIIAFLSIQIRSYTEVIKMKLLIKTPAELIIIIMIVCGTYLIRGGFESLIKFNQLVIWILLLPIVIIFIFSLANINIHNVMPFIDFERTNFLQGIKNSSYAFSGIAIVYLLIPRLSDKDGFRRTASVTFGFVSIFYIIVYLISIGFFGIEETESLLWPFISSVSNIEVPGNFVENWEGIIMVIYMIFNFASFVNAFYVAASIFKSIFNINNIRLSVILVVPLIYIISIIPQNILEVNVFFTYYFPYMYLLNYLILPLSFLLVYRMRRGGKKIA